MGINSPCHEQVLAAAKAIVQSKGVNEFTVHEVLDYMLRAGSRCAKGTVINLLASRCCINAPGHGAKRYAYFERIALGKYRIVV
jgi:hypothetical protein